jgi:hypothetical protein
VKRKAPWIANLEFNSYWSCLLRNGTIIGDECKNGTMWRTILIGVLAILLTACSAAPNAGVLEKAIALQISQTQVELGSELAEPNTTPPAFSVSHVKISERRPLIINDLKAYRVRGTYDLAIAYPDHRVVQRKNPFEVYVQRQSEGKTWRLAQLKRTENNEERWATNLIQ